jgi:hypothetical protein
MRTSSQRQAKIETIRRFPEALAAVVSSLTSDHLNTKYLADEWTIQQIVHHMADSHMNAFIRLKLMLTNERPTLVAYDQDRWVTLPDMELSIHVSLTILRGIHERWCAVWESLADADWARTGNHTQNGLITIDDLLTTYDLHCREHLDQVQRILAAARA